MYLLTIKSANGNCTSSWRHRSKRELFHYHLEQQNPLPIHYYHDLTIEQLTLSIVKTICIKIINLLDVDLKIFILFFS